MADRRGFVDTSGFYALLAREDPQHKRAVEVLAAYRTAGRTAVTTDFVADETATLLEARGLSHLLDSFFEMLATSLALHLEFIGEERFWKTRTYFLKHADHGYSFTDCSSFLLMKELALREALTTDAHFAEAGFVPLLR